MNNNPIVILTHVVNNAALQGFLPAAVALGYPVLLLTDNPLEHQRYFARDGLACYPQEILDCDVFNAQAIIELLYNLQQKPAAIFSNSDHLQTQCAQAAQFFNLPAKDWQVCYRAKNKAAMREYMQTAGVPGVWFKSVNQPEQLSQLNCQSTPFPCVVKPQQGVASLDVERCEDFAQLQRFCLRFWQQHPSKTLLIEAFLQGPLFTLETMGDGENIVPLGGFDVTLSEPPYFIELAAQWHSDVDSIHRRQAFEQVKQFGINFGVCHSEFVLTENGPRLIEINYRSIGDNREFLLNQLAPFDWFEQVLKLHLGEPLGKLEPIAGQALIRYFCAEKEGVLSAHPVAFEQQAPISIKLEHLKTTGEQIRLSHSNKDYLSVLTAVAKGRDQQAMMQSIQALGAKLHWEIQP